MSAFKLISKFKPTGDQPGAIRSLVSGLDAGMPYQTLLGVTGSGKSLDKEEPLLIFCKDRHGKLKQKVVKIGEFIDDLLCQNPKRNRGIEICCSKQQYYTLSFSPRDCKQEVKPIKAFIRHASPSKMYLIKTSCGRETLVTGDHNFWVLRNGKMKLIKTKESQKTDLLPLPTSIPAPDNDLKEINLLELLRGKKLFVEANSLILKLKSEFGGENILRVLSVFYKGAREKLWSIENNSKGCKFPIDIFLKVLRELNYLPSQEDLMTMRLFARARYELPALFQLKDAFIKLMGYFLAEGHGTDRYFLITNFDNEIRKDIRAILSTLKIKYSIRPNSDFQISSKLYAALFAVLLGRKSRDKRLPDFWGELSQRQLALLLRTYYEGDGWVERGGVECCTASKRLPSDLAYALLRFGIWARIRKIKKRATNSTHLGDLYYQVSISSQDNLRRFFSLIGFISRAKMSRLKLELAKTADSNVDLVSGIGEGLKSLRKSLDVSQKQVALPTRISRAMISLIESGERSPTRATLTKIAKTIWNRVDEIGGVERKIYEQIISLTKLTELRWTKIMSIGEIKYDKPYVYDISVADNETFLAGSGGLFLHNTFTMANVIEAVQKPTLVISPNKTLAAQLCQEFRSFFPHNAVEYFVSFYDYYQPEAYIPQTDTYIEKDSAINQEIDRLRHEATMSVMERRDVIVVASVSCIYALGKPEDYKRAILYLKLGEKVIRDEIIAKLIATKYERNDLELNRGKFRVRGDVIEIQQPYDRNFIRIELEDDRVKKICDVDAVTRKMLDVRTSIGLYPGTHYVTFEDRLRSALSAIEQEMVERVGELKKQNKLVEAQRLEQRTKYDLEMIREMGYCSGIENYSRHLDGRAPGEPPGTLMDYFPGDFLLFIDESHVTVPQLRAMYNGDRARKETLVEYGFRLPSAVDNRPLRFDEFQQRMNQAIFVSATPADYEREQSKQIVEQVIRPTGLVDPEVIIKEPKGQIEDLISRIKDRVSRSERVLVTTLTKRMAEDLAEYLNEAGIKVRYLHSDIETLDRIDILRGLRQGKFDVLVGINLLREGLDLPEVSLVAILDADKEGFLRSETSIIQTVGRAARNINGQVILYAENMTGSMKRALKETNRRRKLQIDFNKKHNITPQTIVKEIADISDRIQESKLEEIRQLKEFIPKNEVPDLIRSLEEEMQMAATELNFEKAAGLRDRIKELRKAFGLG